MWVDEAGVGAVLRWHLGQLHHVSEHMVCIPALLVMQLPAAVNAGRRGGWLNFTGPHLGGDPDRAPRALAFCSQGCGLRSKTG